MDLADQDVEKKGLRCENASEEEEEEESSGKNGVCEKIPLKEENHSGIDNLEISDNLNMAESMEVLETGDVVELKTKVDCGDEVVVDANNSSTTPSDPVEPMEVKLDDTGKGSSSKEASTVPAAVGQVSTKVENKNNSSKVTPEESMVTTTALEDVCNTEKLPKKDGTAEPLAVKSEENETLIVLDDDDTDNDLDADLTASGKKTKQLAGGKKCTTTDTAEGATPAKSQKTEQKTENKEGKTKSPASSDDKTTKGKESVNVTEKKEELDTEDKVESVVKSESKDQTADASNTSSVTSKPAGQMESKLEDADSKETSSGSSADQASEKPENKNNNNLNQSTSESDVSSNPSKVVNKSSLLKTAAKSEENESLIVLVDDIHNDLDADLATNNKKSTTVSTTGADAGAKSQKDTKTDKKVEPKKDAKDVKTKSSEDTSKTKKIKPKTPKPCNLWITGLKANTKAANLKALFVKHGWVVSAKVVTTARAPSCRCYGFVIMASTEDANNCIRHLNQTKFNGTVITVKMARNALGMQIQKKSVDPAKKLVNTKKESKPADGAEKCNKVEKKIPQKTEGAKKTAVKSKTSTRSKSKPIKKNWSHALLDPKASKDPWAKAMFEESQSRRKEMAKARLSLRHHRPLELHRSHHHRHHRLANIEPDIPPHIRERRRINELRHLLSSRRESSFDKESYRLEKARNELRTEREKLDRTRRKLVTVSESHLWSKRKRSHSSSSLRYEDERLSKRSFERNHMHADPFWDDHSMDDHGGSLSLRYSSLFPKSRYSDLKDAYRRRGGPYYGRESKNLGSSDHYDVPLSRVSESSSRLHDRYNAPLDSSSRLDMHLNSDKFDRMDTGFRRDSDHIEYESDRQNMLHSRDIDHRSVSAHNRLGRMRSSPDLDWKMDEWSNMSGNMGGGGSRQSDRWVSSGISANHDHHAGGSSSMNSSGYLGRSSGMGGSGSSSGGGMGGSGSGGGGLMLNTGPGNVYSYSHHSGMMSGGGGGGSGASGGGGGGGGGMGGQMRESHYENYTNMRRF